MTLHRAMLQAVPGLPNVLRREAAKKPVLQASLLIDKSLQTA
jgi:hypothetical protein